MCWFLKKSNYQLIDGTRRPYKLACESLNSVSICHQHSSDHPAFEDCSIFFVCPPFRCCLKNAPNKRKQQLDTSGAFE